MSSADRSILIEVLFERIQQDEKWGPQDHQDGTGDEMYVFSADIARESCDLAAKEKKLTWRHILEEEFYESLAETDPTLLRTELIQLAAVATAWVAAIDRRIGPPTKNPLLAEIDSEGDA